MDFKNKKYLRDGSVVDLVQVLEKGSLISRAVSYWYGDEEHCELDSPSYYEGEVFDKAPIPVYAKSIVEMNAGIDQKRSEKRAIEQEIVLLRKEAAQLEKEMDLYPDLKRFAQFVQGKLQWIVHEHYGGWRVSRLEDSLKGCNKYDRGYLKLASAYGKSEGDVEFKINEYSGGSGSTQTFVPFETRDEAEAHVINHLRSLEKYTSSTFYSANAIGFDLDPFKVIEYHRDALNRLKKGIEYTATQYHEKVGAIEEKEQLIANLENGLPF